MCRYFYFIVLLLISFEAISAGAQIELYPLCYSRETTCRMASEILKLPWRGNFRLRSRCRKKSQKEIRQRLCHKWNSVLQIQTVLELPNIGQWVWRNQCFNNMLACKNAAEIWRELNHKNLSFYAECGPFKRNMWKFPDNELRKKGIFKCGGSNYIELRIRAKRVR